MNRKPRNVFMMVFLAAASVGCASSPRGGDVRHGSPGSGTTAGSEQRVQRLDPIVVSAHGSSSHVADFQKARALLKAGKAAEAIRLFEPLTTQHADAHLAALSLYNAGVAYEQLEKFEEALARHEQVVSSHAGHRIVVPSLIRITRLLGYLERWDDLTRTATAVLARHPLTVMDRIEALGAMALGLVQKGKDEEAERYVNRARDIIEEKQFGRAGKPPVQLAQVAFAEGEVRRLRSERIKLVPVTPDFIQVLERRCGGLLSAQRAYTDAMRSRDAHWSAMAGYRVGQLYEVLHAEAMKIPAPEDAPEEKQKLFRAAMRLRYRILLTKGLKMMNATLRIAERTGEQSEWIRRAAESKSNMEKSLAEEREALAKLPFTEEEIRAALSGLKNRSD